MMLMDGNQAAAYIAYAFSEAAVVYPITPSSTMAESVESWAVEGRENIFGKPVKIAQMQSEAGVAGALHGALMAGAFTTSFSASQGLLLMIPNMYKIAGELLPCVIHVAARTISSHALSIFGDHQDVYGIRQTGFAMLCSNNVQEAMDIAAAAHLATVKGRVPVLHFFDGFRTSHELQKVEEWKYEELKEMFPQKEAEEFRSRGVNPNNPILRGSAQNPDIFFQVREASNSYYDAFPKVVEHYLQEINKRRKTDYHLFEYYGAKDADQIIIAMGSVCNTIEEVIDSMKEKVGLIKVRLFRPFCKESFLEKIPKTVKKISVLDRTKEPGAIGEPLYLEIAAALKETDFETVPLYGGRYGLSSKDTTPSQIRAVYANEQKKKFTIGIRDDVTNLSLEPVSLPGKGNDKGKVKKGEEKGQFSCKFWGYGSDGTVGANKNTVKLMSSLSDGQVQAYFEYDSKKSGGLTISHLRFSKEKIRSSYLIYEPDFAACHNVSYLEKYDIVEEIREGGAFLLNCPYEEAQLEEKLPGKVKKLLAEKNISFWIIDAGALSREIGLRGKTSTILQAAFFQASGLLPREKAEEAMQEAVKKSFGKKGEEVVEKNVQGIRLGFEKVKRISIPGHWKEAREKDLRAESRWKKESAGQKDLQGEKRADVIKFVNDILEPLNAGKGNELPVSAFLNIADGTLPIGTAAYEKRGIADEVAKWIPENCIQCNICSYVCPHSVIRPAVCNQEEAESAPKGMELLAMIGMPDCFFGITVSVMDCTGCGACIENCPGKMGKKALEYSPLAKERAEKKQDYFAYGQVLSPKEEVLEKFPETTVKGSQFKKPLLEFSGACPGCGETPYAKLVTQLFGERMVVANATGCSSIWGGSVPSAPYTVSREGKGPAWASSLFEDNAEFGYGITMAEDILRKEGDDKISHWIFGGDGWAYDIGFGGLDHVAASGMDINILIFDTEVYSNTGGQQSKATPFGATAKFSLEGKRKKKKDLAMMLMQYENVYIAQVAQGADRQHCIKVLLEAESYPGPSIIIAYAPCISHGIMGGMSNAQATERLAVDTGYFHLFRYDPRRLEEGKGPFVLDSKKPKESYEEFVKRELRFKKMTENDAEAAKEYLEEAVRYAEVKYERLKLLEKLMNLEV